MHFSNLVIIEKPEDGDIDGAVESMMGEPGEWWDWFSIGGRFTGWFDGYNPNTAPANIITCNVCGGTGIRPGGLGQFGAEWFDGCHGCNGCNGKGTHVTWPTEWGRHDGDVVPLTSVTQEQYEHFYRVVCSSGRFDSEEYLPWTEEKFSKKPLPPLSWLKANYLECLAVVVDNHN
jgi:hypothetical protein